MIARIALPLKGMGFAWTHHSLPQSPRDKGSPSRLHRHLQPVERVNVTIAIHFRFLLVDATGTLLQALVQAQEPAKPLPPLNNDVILAIALLSSTLSPTQLQCVKQSLRTAALEVVYTLKTGL